MASPVDRFVPVIFPDALVHDIVAKAFIGALRKHGWTGCKVESAGEIDMAAIQTFGSSETLGVEAREEDAEIITTYDYTHGVVNYGRS